MCYLIISKNFNQISNLLSLKKFLIYLLLKNMLLEATSNLNIALFQSTMKKKIHYHILIQVDSEEQLNQFFPSQKCFSVPCIFTCFKYLVSPAKDVKGNGELFDKLKLALTYSAQPAAANLDLLDFTHWSYLSRSLIPLENSFGRSTDILKNCFSTFFIFLKDEKNC